MIKKILRKTIIYSLYRRYIANPKMMVEINKRIAENNLLKDLNETELHHWNERIATVLASEDNKKIDCVPNAGTLQNGLLIMHNGTVIEPLSYYGYPILKMLLNNKGIHEPQEEYVFQEVLKEMPTGATMIELGAYWSFYSMWFNKTVKNAVNYMIEPENVDSGKNNFRLNKLKGKFFQHYITDKPGMHHNGISDISVDEFIKNQKIEFVDILHSDIQGYELLMLKGADHLLSKKNVGYIFISTHSNELHEDCMNYLDGLGYIKVCSANLDETFSVDGLLVYKNPAYRGIDKLDISLRTSNKN